MAELHLVTGGAVIIDDADVPMLSCYRWYKDQRGYVVASAGLPETIRMHRLLLSAGEDQVVDHINGNTLDNRKANLRICSHAQNMQNRRMHKNNRLGIKGVYFDASKPSRLQYRAQISVNGTKIRLGRFATPEEASKAYQAASLKYHGDFARPAEAERTSI